MEQSGNEGKRARALPDLARLPICAVTDLLFFVPVAKFRWP